MQTQEERYLWLLSRKLSGSITEEENKELESLSQSDQRLRSETEAMQAFWAHGANRQQDDRTQQAFEQLKNRMQAEGPQMWPVEGKGTGGGKWRGLLLRSAAAAVLLGGSYYLLSKTAMLPWQDGLKAD
jgi:hypothetical protein